jgi:hypothetical protein
MLYAVDVRPAVAVVALIRDVLFGYLAWRKIILPENFSESVQANNRIVP